MKRRRPAGAERETQIVALWRDRPRDRRGPDDVVPFYRWLVEHAPWLVPRRQWSPGSLDYVRGIVQAHMIGPA